MPADLSNLDPVNAAEAVGHAVCGMLIERCAVVVLVMRADRQMLEMIPSPELNRHVADAAFLGALAKVLLARGWSAQDVQSALREADIGQ